MDEYIDRNELLEMIAARLRDTCNGTMSCLQMKRAVEKIPPADVAPVVHGWWVPSSDGEWADCSECGECYDAGDEGMKGMTSFELFRQFYKFCPNCGAKMDADA